MAYKQASYAVSKRGSKETSPLHPVHKSHFSVHFRVPSNEKQPGLSVKHSSKLH